MPELSALIDGNYTAAHHSQLQGDDGEGRDFLLLYFSPHANMPQESLSVVKSFHNHDSSIQTMCSDATSLWFISQSLSQSAQNIWSDDQM